MYCPKCNSEIDENIIVCPVCGFNIVPQEESLNKEINDAEDLNKEKFNNYINLIVFIFLFLFLLIISFFIFINSTNMSINNNIMPEENSNIVISIVIGAMVLLSAIFCSKIKNLVLSVSRWLLDFVTALDLCFSFIILVAGISLSQNFEINYWWFILVSLIYFVIALTKDYLVYLLVDIRDSLKLISKNYEKNKK